MRLNLSGSGVSLGLGPPGFNVNIGPKGVRKTVGLPGTGVSYQSFSAWRRKPPASSASSAGPGSALPQPPAPSQLPPPQPALVGASSASSSGLWVKLGLIGFIFVGLGYLLYPFLDRATSSNLDLATKRPAATSKPNDNRASTPTAPAPSTLPPSTDSRTRTLPVAAPATLPSSTDSALSVDEVRQLQSILKALGFDPGDIDGIVGPLTTGAVSRYEEANQRPRPGNIDRKLLELLLEDAKKRGIR